MSDNKYFKHNRYSKEDFFISLEKIEHLEKVIYVDINKDDVIEVYLYDIQEHNREYIKEIFSNIEAFDYFVQNFCEKNYKNKKSNYKAYIVELSWMSIEKDKVIMRYWGKFVNVELEVIYVKINNKWIVEDIYYC